MKIDKAKLISLAERINASHTVAELEALPEAGGKTGDKAKQALFTRLHPDQYLDDDEDHAIAGELFRNVARIFADADREHEGGATTFTVRGKNGIYAAGSQIATGTVAAIFRGVGVEGTHAGKPVCIKVALDPDDNGLIEHEHKVMSGLKSYGIPEIIDSVEHESGSRGTVMELINGVDLYSFRELPKHRNGVSNPFHVGWFLERTLHILGKLHENMIVHGNVEPGHLVIVPGAEHRVVLVDYCFSAMKPKVKDKIGVFTEFYSAPEVEAKGKPHPAMDLYSLGMCAIYLLGGDVEKKSLPKDLDPRLVRFINELVEADPEYRASDAYVMANRIWMTRKQIWGKFGLVELEV